MVEALNNTLGFILRKTKINNIKNIIISWTIEGLRHFLSLNTQDLMNNIVIPHNYVSVRELWISTCQCDGGARSLSMVAGYPDLLSRIFPYPIVDIDFNVRGRRLYPPLAQITSPTHIHLTQLGSARKPHLHGHPSNYRASWRCLTLVIGWLPTEFNACVRLTIVYQYC